MFANALTIYPPTK